MNDWYSKNAASNTSLLPNARAEYESKIMQRKPAMEDSPAAASPVAAQGGLQAVGQKVGGDMATQGAQNGDLPATLGGAAMMSGNPYLMAAGLGLQVVSAGEKNRRAEEEAQRQTYNDRISQRQMAMSQIASMGIK